MSMNHKRKALFGLLALFAVSAHAKNVKDCIQLSNDDERLACYDKLFLKNAKVQKKDNSILEPTKPNTPAVAAKPELPNKDNQTKQNTDWFGIEHKAVSATPDSLESRAIGSFKDWKKKMKIELENGQIWEVTSSRSMYYKTENPKVTIEKGALGAFYMGIEGINRRLKVKRIK